MTTTVDTHQHFWDPSTGRYGWMTGPLEVLAERQTPEDLRPHLDRYDIDGTILVQAIGEVEETRDLLSLATMYDWILAVVGWVDLTDPGAGDMIDELRSGRGGHHLAGIRHQVQDEPDPDWLLRPDVRRGLQVLRDKGLRYELLVNPTQMPAAVQLVREMPDLAFILDHVGKPPIASGELEPWASLIGRLAREPNVTCKFSGMATQADWQHWTTEDLRPYADQVLRVFGPERLMYGSDWPFCHLAATYRQQYAATRELLAELSTNEREAVMGGTAVESYGLPDVD